MTTGQNWLADSGVRYRMEFLRLCKTLHYTMQDGIDRYIRMLGMDLTTSQLDVVICVAQGCGGPVNQKDIEEQLRLSNPTVTGILKRLERKGFVTRTVDRRDRRCKVVQLTEKCARMGEQLYPNAERMLGGMFEDFAEEDFRTLNQLLGRLVINCGRTVSRLETQEDTEPRAAAALASGAAR